MASRSWTIVELNRASALCSQGMTTQEIADQLGRPRAGVRSVLKAHGIRTRLRGRPKSEDRILELDRTTARQALVGSQKLLAAIQIAGVRP